MAVPDHRAVLVEHLQSLATDDVPPQRVPWANAGWYEEAVAWIEDGLVDFYRLLYGPNDIYLGFRLVGDSFHRSGFYSHAIDAFSQGLDYMKNASSGTKGAFDESWQETERHMSECIDHCREQIAYLEAD